MSPPTGRVLALLELLQTVPGVTVVDIASQLNVDERTIRRDVAHLCGLGIPIKARRGRTGGLHLVRGYRLPPLILTNAEAAAIVLGLVFSRHYGLNTGANGAAAADAALTKIRRLLPEKLASDIDAMLSSCALETAAIECLNGPHDELPS